MYRASAGGRTHLVCSPLRPRVLVAPLVCHGSSSHSLNCEGWVCIERVQVGARTLSDRLCVCSSPHWCVDAAAGCASRGAARAGGDGACTWMALRSRSTCPPWSDVGEEWNGVDVQGTDVGGEWNDVAWGL